MRSPKILNEEAFNNRERVIEYKYLNYPIVSAHFHNTTSNIKFAILCQHGYNSDSFLENFPRFSEPLQKLPSEIISLYLELEHDSKSIDIAAKLTEYLSDEIAVMVILVNCNRGIMDANRLGDFCIPMPLQKIYSKKILNELKVINEYVRESIFSLFNCYLGQNSYILDLHSMWPYNMQEISDESNFESINLSYLSPLFRGRERNINFISNDSNGNLISSIHLSNSLETALTDKGYLIEHDNPYYMSSIRSNYHYFLRYKGLAIDIPRNLLGESSSSDPYDFSYMQKDEKKISDLSFTMAEGLLRCIT